MGERTSTDSNWLIEKVYHLDKAGGFRDDESHEASISQKDSRLGSQMSVNLWLTAWLDGAEGRGG
jgi:hypothetical protein